MITTCNRRPNTYSRAWSPIVWQVQSSKSNMTDYKYIFNIYVNNSLYSTIKQRPNPQGYGIIDVSKFCQANLDVGASLTEHQDQATWYRVMGPNCTGEVYVLAGEEYRTTVNGPLIQYNGNTDLAGAPAYKLYAGADGLLNSSITNNAPVIYNAGYRTSKDNYDYLYYVYGTTDGVYSSRYGHTGRFMSELPIQTGANSWVRETSLHDYERFSLTFQNNTYYTGITGQAFVYAAQFEFVTTAGATSTYNAINSVVTGGGPLSTSSAVMPATGSQLYNIVELACGPMDVRQYIEESTFATVSYYTVSLWGRTGTTGITLYRQYSEKIKINLVEQDCWGFGNWRFSWLNKLGGRDWFNFVKKNTEEYSTKRETYYKIDPYWSGGVYNAASNDPAKFGDSVSKNTVNQSFSAMSDWVTEDQSKYLKSLFISSHVLAWDPDGNGPFLVSLDSNKFEVKKFANERMFNYTIEFTIGQPTNLQTT